MTPSFAPSSAQYQVSEPTALADPVLYQQHLAELLQQHHSHHPGEGPAEQAPVAEQTDPPLTTVRQDIEEMGRLMARLLLRGLDRLNTDEGPEGAPSSVVTPTTLVRRASA